MTEYVHELIPVYEEYVEFLSCMDGEMDGIVRDRFLLDAETNLQKLYDINFERMIDEGLIDEKCYDRGKTLYNYGNSPRLRNYDNNAIIR